MNLKGNWRFSITVKFPLFSSVEDFEGPKVLTKDEAADCLNCVGPTFRKIDKAFSYSSCSYAYVAMNVVGR